MASPPKMAQEMSQHIPGIGGVLINMNLNYVTIRSPIAKVWNIISIFNHKSPFVSIHCKCKHYCLDPNVFVL